MDQDKILFQSDIQTQLGDLELQRERIFSPLPTKLRASPVHDVDFYVIILRRLFRQLEEIARKDSRIANLKGQYRDLAQKIKIRDHFEHKVDGETIQPIDVSSLPPGTISAPAGANIRISTSLMGRDIISGNLTWNLDGDHMAFVELITKFSNFYPFNIKPQPSYLTSLWHIFIKLLPAIISSIGGLAMAYYISASITPWFIQTTWFIAGFDLIIFFSTAVIFYLIFYSWIKSFYSWIREYYFLTREKKVEKFWLFWQRSLKYAGGIIFLTAAFLGTATGIIALFFPAISVSQSTPLNPADPFSAPFIVSNDGALVIDSVQFDCLLNNLQTNQITVTDGDFEDDSQFVDTMDAGEKRSVQCAFEDPSLIKFDLPQIYKSADITLAVRFRVAFVPWYQTRTFRFMLAKATDGSFYWYPQPNSDLNESSLLKDFIENGH